MTTTATIGLREISATASTGGAGWVQGFAAGAKGESVRAALGRWTIREHIGLVLVFHSHRIPPLTRKSSGRVNFTYRKKVRKYYCNRDPFSEMMIVSRRHHQMAKATEAQIALIENLIYRWKNAAAADYYNRGGLPQGR